MSAQTLNVIYDTNYTSVVKDWGFVDHQFAATNKKPWFFDSLFWNKSSWTPQVPVQNTQNQTTTEAQTMPQKAPGFFDLLFWPLWNKNWQNAIWAATQAQTQPTDQAVSQQSANNTNTQVGANAANITQNHEIAQTTLEANEAKEEEKPKKKSWIDSMLDSVFWTDEWSQKKSDWKSKSKWDSTKDKQSSDEDKKETERERQANELR